MLQHGQNATGDNLNTDGSVPYSRPAFRGRQVEGAVPAGNKAAGGHDGVLNIREVALVRGRSPGRLARSRIQMDSDGEERVTPP